MATERPMQSELLNLAASYLYATANLGLEPHKVRLNSLLFFF